MSPDLLIPFGLMLFGLGMLAGAVLRGIEERKQARPRTPEYVVVRLNRVLYEQICEEAGWGPMSPSQLDSWVALACHVRVGAERRGEIWGRQ